MKSVLCALMLTGSLSAGRGAETEAKTPAEEPLLLLDESTPVLAAPKGPVADNSRCFVCHLNYSFEKLAVSHAQANIGCIKCHGESKPHSTDEDNVTAPDRLFPKSHVRFVCLGCHDWVKLVESDQKKTDLTEKPDHQSVLDGTAKEKKLCSDCHGEHRLVHRTRMWDKRTGKLLFKDATPPMLRGASQTGAAPPEAPGGPEGAESRQVVNAR